MPRTDGLRATRADHRRPGALRHARDRAHHVRARRVRLRRPARGRVRASCSRTSSPPSCSTPCGSSPPARRCWRPRHTRRLIEAFVAQAGGRRPAPTTASSSELTAREREVLALVGRGLSNARDRRRLVLSPLTAKTHVARLFTKLGARDRAQLVVHRLRDRARAPRPPLGAAGTCAMADFTVVRADDVTDHYAGTDVPGRVPLARRRARRRAARDHADPGAAALGLRAGHGPLPRRDRGALRRHARDADDALRGRDRARRGRLGRARGADDPPLAPQRGRRARRAVGALAQRRDGRRAQDRRVLGGLAGRRADALGQPRSRRGRPCASRFGARASHASASSSSSSATSIAPSRTRIAG